MWRNKEQLFKNVTLSRHHQKQTSKGYHELAENADIAQNLGRLLSLGRKFIPQRPRVPIHQHDSFLESLEKHVRTNHMSREIYSQPFRLYCRNDKWQPDPASEEVETDLQNFKTGVLSAVNRKLLNQPRDKTSLENKKI